MSQVFAIGERLVWIHIDEDTGRKVQELVVIRRISESQRVAVTGKPYYIVQVLRTGEPASCFHDELYRYTAE